MESTNALVRGEVVVPLPDLAAVISDAEKEAGAAFVGDRLALGSALLPRCQLDEERDELADLRWSKMTRRVIRLPHNLQIDNTSAADGQLFTATKRMKVRVADLKDGRIDLAREEVA